MPSEDSVQFMSPANSRPPEQAAANFVKVRTDPASLAYPGPRHDLSWPTGAYYNDSHTLADSIAGLTPEVNGSPGRGSLVDESDWGRLSDGMSGLFSNSGESIDGRTGGPGSDSIGNEA